ncbi:MAG TPA: methyltransferase domain-containing protein [Anaerolineae bacterium]|nr:methyltransferase domain-containing protein [Anaerolineae bacterium]
MDENKTHRVTAVGDRVPENAGLTVDDKATIQTKSRYNRIAPVYDWMEAIVERSAFRRWREMLWSQVDADGNRVMEVGAGTGKNLPHYPRGVQVTAVDLSDRMLERARRRAGELGVEVDLSLTDAQRLAFPDDVFDAAVATFVFCSVPDPVLGLRELARVVRPGGRVILLEHVRVNKPLIGKVMDLLDPLVAWLMGPHINRRTVENVKKAGLEIERVEELTSGGLVKFIIARTGHKPIGG